MNTAARANSITPADTGAPLLRAENVHKTYKLGRLRVPVLRGASIDVRPGEWVAILGASGSGKSTLLHLLGGLDRPDARTPEGSPGGRIVFNGRALNERSSAELDRYRGQSVGFVFQFYHLLPELSALENTLVAAMAGLGKSAYRANRAEIRAHAESLLGAFGLGQRLAHRPNELSGGERQRVAIARALINRPAVLLADEPTGNLDRKTGDAILDVVASLHREQGQTIVMVTHDAAIAARADRVVHLVDGVVAQPAPTP